MTTPALLKAYFALTAVTPWLLKHAAKRQHLRQSAASERLCERMGQATKPCQTGPLIWLHAASVGEVQSAVALAPLLAEKAQLLVTTATQTGADRARAVLPKGTLHQFQPIDTPLATRKFLAHWQPDLALFVEADLWPRMCRALAQNGTPTALLNARSSKSRARFPRVYKEMLSSFNVITCQSDMAQKELQALGISPDVLFTFGDLKAALPKPEPDAAALAAFRAAAGKRPLWAAVSTHAADEAHVLAAHRDVLRHTPEALLLWLPRHPARATAIRDAAKDLHLAQRSLGEAVTSQSQILLADTLGEAGAAFATAPVVFLGGSFGREGGHTPYEPAKAGCYVLSGPNVANFKDAYARLSREGYATLLDSSTALAQALTTHMRRPHKGLWQSQSENAVAKTAAKLLSYVP